MIDDSVKITRTTIHDELRRGVAWASDVEVRNVKRGLEEILAEFSRRRRRVNSILLAHPTLKAGVFQATVVIGSSTRKTSDDIGQAAARACGVAYTKENVTHQPIGGVSCAPSRNRNGSSREGVGHTRRDGTVYSQR